MRTTRITQRRKDPPRRKGRRDENHREEIMGAQMKPELAKIGMIGLAVMGENLALNIARNGYPIAVFNRDTSKVDKFLHRAEGKQVIGAYSIEEFVRSLEKPRKIILLVKAGGPVDAVLEQLKPLLEPNDIVI